MRMVAAPRHATLFDAMLSMLIAAAVYCRYATPARCFATTLDDMPSLLPLMPCLLRRCRRAIRCLLDSSHAAHYISHSATLLRYMMPFADTPAC